jgi:hypothetical protein
MARATLSPEEVRSLQDLANPGLSRPTLSDALKAKFTGLGLGQRKRGHYVITEQGRRVLWDLAGRRGA